MKHYRKFTTIIALLTSINCAYAGDSGNFNVANTGFLFLSTIILMTVIPGLALLYSGMSKNNNIVSTILHSLAKLGTIWLVWYLCAYSIAFSENSISGYFGDLKYALLGNLSINTLHSESSGIPTYLVVVFQCMLAVIAAVILTGSFAERMRIIPAMLFASIWVIVVYAPVAHWIWGGGWLHKALNTLDFAGGTVIHLNAAIGSLVTALMIGKKTHPISEARPYNSSLTILGCILLWLGWFGYNSAGAYTISNVTVLAMLNTNTAAATGAVAWLILAQINQKKLNMLGIVNGILAGLIAISPAAGYIEISSAFLIGSVSSALCYWSIVILKPKLGYDNSLEIFAIHGIGGLWGTIATGIFATTKVNGSGQNGLLNNNLELLVNQFLSAFIVIAYSAVATFLVLFILKNLIRLRVTPLEERKNLDIVELGETGYRI